MDLGKEKPTSPATFLSGNLSSRQGRMQHLRHSDNYRSSIILDSAQPLVTVYTRILDSAGRSENNIVRRRGVMVSGDV